MTLPPPGKFPTGTAVQLYIAAIAAVMLASRAWRYRQRYTAGMAASALAGQHADPTEALTEE
ncbi:hypothetical protein [Mesorhizobium sp. M1E.F.Ca.ET.045.02.1.1]|uniref:hypothetical protein n=1 Tax=Mesorhizobium sp. M1E.F.Ca.ET.045.02.1.1 TaxID=2493672 RepID=UPI0016761878|nr:hypothetical protein [Mesorhizobium sp. M1E.F.Ca.ET.045.02.1.1]